MPDHTAGSRVAAFGPYVLDARSGEIRKAGLRIRLGEQPFQILLLLLERPGQLVTREELRARLWAEQTFVDFEHGLNSAIQRLRVCLSDTAGDARWIETVPRRGYRFVGQLEWQEAPKINSVTTVPIEAEPAPNLTSDAAGQKANWWELGARRVVVIGLGSLLLLLTWPVATWVRHHRVPPEKQSDAIQSVAILPLRDLSGDPNQEYFADGITEMLITDLGQLKSLRVISHTSVDQYKATRKTIPEIARELNVDALVEGTVTRSQGRVRVTANLVNAFPEKHLWAHTYERDLHDVLSLQADISEAVARAVQVQVTPQGRGLLSSRRPVMLEAQEEYFKGLSYFSRGWDRFFVRKEGQQDIRRSISYFQQAVTLDPQYAQAYASLARSYLWLSETDGPGVEVRARVAADKAVELDETLPEPHMVRGFLLLSGDPNWAGAERELLRSIELNPSFSQGRQAYAIYLSSRGRFDQATTEAESAVMLDPVSRSPKSQAAWIDVCAGRYDRGIARLRNIIELNKEDSLSHQGLGIAYVLQGRAAEGIAELRKSDALAGENPNRDRYLGWAYGVTGEKQRALKVLKELKHSSSRDVQSRFGVAVIYAGLGDNDQTIAWLQKTYDGRHDSLNDVLREPSFLPLREDPRFRSLLRKVGSVV